MIESLVLDFDTAVRSNRNYRLLLGLISFVFGYIIGASLLLGSLAFSADMPGEAGKYFAVGSIFVVGGVLLNIFDKNTGKSSWQPLRDFKQTPTYN